MKWQRISDSLSWSQGHSGKGYLLHDGTIKTWNVDPFNPVDHNTVHQQNQEKSPSALNFEIDPDGGVVTQQPTIKVQTIVNTDPRLYDAGQRPVFEDNWDLQDYDDKTDKDNHPDYNFIMSRQAPDPWVTPKPYHYHPWSGLPCVCQWGQPKQKGKTSSSQYLRQIKNQNQKAFRDEHGQKFLAALDELIKQYPDAEGMIPWMAAQYKQGHFTLGQDGEIHHWGEHTPVSDYVRTYNAGMPPNRDPAEPQISSPIEYGRRIMEDEPFVSYYRHTAPYLTDWSHWFNARQHPTRRGINIMEHTPYSVRRMVAQHVEALREANKKKRWLEEYAHPNLDQWSRPDIQHVFGPEAGKYQGWNVVKLNPFQAEGDSEALGHCIGQDDQPYKHNIDIGNIRAYSLRDKEGYPHVSWHINPSGDDIGHMQGKSGDPPEDYRNLITHFNKKHGLPDEEGYEEQLEGAYDEEYDLRPASSIEEWLYQLDDPHSAAEENGDANIGPETRINVPDPSWTDLAWDYLHNGGNSSIETLHRTLGHQPWDRSEFANALRSEMDLDNQNDRQMVGYWNSEGARTSDDWVDIPQIPTNEVDKYNDAIDEGEEPNVEDWHAMARDYLAYPGHYQDHYYPAFHENLRGYDHEHLMHSALDRNVDWSVPSHQEAMQHWNNYWATENPEWTIPNPNGPQYVDPEEAQQPHTQGSPEGWNQPTSSWHLAGDFWGYNNWETGETKLYIDNERAPYETTRKIVSQGGGPDQLKQYVIRAVIAPHNKRQIADAQEWNAIPREEREQQKRQRDIDQFGEEAVNMGHGLLEPFFGDPYAEEEVEAAEIIDPEKVDWYAIYQDIHEELMNEYPEPSQPVPPLQPNPMDQPSDFTLPEGWTNTSATNWEGLAPMDPITVQPQKPKQRPRTTEEAIFWQIGEAMQNGDYDRARYLYQFLPDEINPMKTSAYEDWGRWKSFPPYYMQLPLEDLANLELKRGLNVPQNAPNMLAPSVELQEWLADLGVPEEAPSIHHDSPEDTVMSPPVSPSQALPYFPPANIPKQYKQATEVPPHTEYPDLWCSECGNLGMQYFPQAHGGATWYCPHCKKSYHTHGIPTTGNPDADHLIYQGVQSTWPQWHRISPEEANNTRELEEMVGIREPAPVRCDICGRETRHPEDVGIGRYCPHCVEAARDEQRAIEQEEEEHLRQAQPLQQQGERQWQPLTDDELGEQLQQGQLTCRNCHRLLTMNEGFAQVPNTDNYYCLPCANAQEQDPHLAAQATDCQTPDAVYKTDIGDDSVKVTVDLPMKLDVDEDKAEQLEANIHNALELVLAPYFKTADAPIAQTCERCGGPMTPGTPYGGEPSRDNPMGWNCASCRRWIINPEAAKPMMTGLIPYRSLEDAGDPGLEGELDHLGIDPETTMWRLQALPVDRISYDISDWALDPESHGEVDWRPIAVYPEGEWYHLLDGRHRTEQAKAEGISTIEGYVLVEDPPQGTTASAKTADAPINQADATNDALGKSPALIPSPKEDLDFLKESICPNCQQLHRPDEPCPDSSVTQYKQQERQWYNHNPNMIHSQPDGLTDHVKLTG